MNTRQKELLCKAIEQGATCWMSVKGEVCCAWLADDTTAYNFFYDNVKGNATKKHEGTIQRLSISGQDNDVVIF